MLRLTRIWAQAADTEVYEHIGNHSAFEMSSQGFGVVTPASGWSSEAPWSKGFQSLLGLLARGVLHRNRALSKCGPRLQRLLVEVGFICDTILRGHVRCNRILWSELLCAYMRLTLPIATKCQRGCRWVMAATLPVLSPLFRFLSKHYVLL